MNGTVCSDADIATGEHGKLAPISASTKTYFTKLQSTAANKKGGPDNRPALRGYCNVNDDYGVAFGAGPMTGGNVVLVVTGGAGEQPLPSHAASKSTE
jgi:hypothetical protein